MFKLFNRKAQKETTKAKVSQGLKKTRVSLTQRLARVFLGQTVVDQNIIEEIEMVLLSADVGVSSTESIIQSIKDALSEYGELTKEQTFKVIKNTMVGLIKQPKHKTKLPKGHTKVVLVVGVNGVGKTTSVAKLVKREQLEDKKVLVAAGDTYRAAAVQQLRTWCERLDVPIVAQQDGADPAAVIYDALSSAKAKKMDVMIADTAGRLHTQDNLMNELEKVQRVLKKIDEHAPHETLIVLDATTGQTAFNQVKVFSDLIGIDGIILTKLDGTAKGGIIFAIQDKLGVPVKYIGVGEGVDDLSEFKPKDFVEALFD